MDFTEPRTWSCTDDAPENNGWGWYRWPEPKEREPDEDDYCGDENDFPLENPSKNDNQNNP